MLHSRTVLGLLAVAPFARGWPAGTAVAQAPTDTRETARDDIRGEVDTKEPDRESSSGGLNLVLVPLGAYTPERGVIIAGFGALSWGEPGAISDVQLLTGVTTRGGAGLKVAPTLWFDGRQHRVAGELEARLEHEFFYGIGNDSPDQGEPYDERRLGVELSARTHIVGSLYAGIVTRHRLYAVEDLEAQVLGDTGARVSGLGLELVWDSRSHEHDPHSGLLLRQAMLVLNEIFGSEFEYVLFTTDLRGYLPIYAEHRLVSRLAFETVMGEAPFYELPELGGSYVLRGAEKGRFRDDSLAVLQLEYRFPLIDRLGGVAFGGYGVVGSSPAKLVAWGHLRGGLGLRYRLSQGRRLRARLDLAFDPAPSLYFTFGEAF